MADLLAAVDERVRALATTLRDELRRWLPDATEEVDPTARLIAYTFLPGTYRGLVTAIALQRSYVNLMFGRGVELLEHDDAGLLEGTGKKARHITIRDEDTLRRPEIEALVRTAAGLTPRS